MLHTSRYRLLATASACLALLSACGGGATGTTPTAVVPVPPLSISGTVAVGAPMLHGIVTIKDANGVTVSGAAAADGSYSGLSVQGMTAPFRIEACGLVGGANTCYYSVVSKAGIANVTPLTHAAVSLALGKDAAAMFDPAASAAAPTEASLAAKKQNLLDALTPILTALGLPTTVDFASDAFAANRTGMDKLLDAVKITTGADAAGSGPASTFVQVEGKIGSGNVFIGSDGTKSGTIVADATGLAVDMTGISTLFASMSSAIGAASLSTCATQMAGIFDPAFRLKAGGDTALTADTAATGICTMASLGGLLGGVVANPVMKECDLAGVDKVCAVGFQIVNQDAVFDGAELSVVLHSGSTAWKLLGRQAADEIHVGAAVQRTSRVDVVDSPARYTRALSFDIGTNEGTIRAARVYQRNLAGTGWESTPMAVLDDSACLNSSPRLSIVGSSCGSSWLSLDNFGGDLAGGDALIDAFYKRGRQVKVELYADRAATHLSSTVIKRVDGVPPKASALAGVPWIELEAATKKALASYDGALADFTATWAGNASVSPKDISFCLSSNCSGAARAAHSEVDGKRHGATSKKLTWGPVPAGASAYKQISLYGRDRDQVGVSSNFVSCGGALNCN